MHLPHPSRLSGSHSQMNLGCNPGAGASHDSVIVDSGPSNFFKNSQTCHMSLGRLCRMLLTDLAHTAQLCVSKDLYHRGLHKIGEKYKMQWMEVRTSMSTRKETASCSCYSSLKPSD
jgi:hypothetical protein